MTTACGKRGRKPAQRARLDDCAFQIRENCDAYQISRIEGLDNRSVAYQDRILTQKTYSASRARSGNVAIDVAPVATKVPIRREFLTPLSEERTVGCVIEPSMFKFQYPVALARYEPEVM
jgi:hypothetical protein